MKRNVTFWISMAVFQVAFGFVVFAITRDYYKLEDTAMSSNALQQATAVDRFSSIDASLLTTLGDNAAFPQDPLAVARQADQSFSAGQYARAAELYGKLAAMDPGNVDTLNNLGLTLHYTGRSEEALQKLNEGIAADPSYQRIWLTLGFVNSSVGNRQAAREALNTALTMDPDTEVGRSAARMLDEL